MLTERATDAACPLLVYYRLSRLLPTGGCRRCGRCGRRPYSLLFSLLLFLTAAAAVTTTTTDLLSDVDPPRGSPGWDTAGFTPFLLLLLPFHLTTLLISLHQRQTTQGFSFFLFLLVSISDNSKKCFLVTYARKLFNMKEV